MHDAIGGLRFGTFYQLPMPWSPDHSLLRTFAPGVQPDVTPANAAPWALRLRDGEEIALTLRRKDSSGLMLV